jgi:cysteine desulfuration protein SufE
MTISEKENELIEDFAVYEDWMDKYEHIIHLGKELPMIDEAHKLDENIIKGCQSTVWLHAELRGGKVYFTADADAIIAKGLVAMLTGVLTNQSPTDIVESELNFIKTIGLQEHLSPSRSNGLVAMVKQMKRYALAFQMKE